MGILILILELPVLAAALLTVLLCIRQGRMARGLAELLLLAASALILMSWAAGYTPW